MRTLTYFVAVILIIGWVFGYLVLHAGGSAIHILLFIVAIILAFDILTGKDPLD